MSAAVNGNLHRRRPGLFTTIERHFVVAALNSHLEERWRLALVASSLRSFPPLGLRRKPVPSAVDRVLAAHRPAPTHDDAGLTWRGKRRPS